MQDDFFSSFGHGSPNMRIVFDPTPPPLPPNYEYNGMILEIANNFPFVRWLMYRHKEQQLKNVKDNYEGEWFKFLLNNYHIDVLKFNNKEEDKFVQEYYRTD